MASRQAQKWALKLAKGDSLAVLLKEDCALDPLFLRFFSTGLSCGRPAQMLFSYTEAGFHRLKQDLKRISALLQTAAYGSIGILALSMYQIMLAPLQMLESF